MSEALRLADALDVFIKDAGFGPDGNTAKTVAELRRLDALNKELLDALKHLEHNARKSGAELGLALDVARAAIEKGDKP